MARSRNSQLRELDAALLAARRLWERPSAMAFLSGRVDNDVELQHYRVLRAVRQADATSGVGQVADRLDIDRTTASRLIDRLVTGGYVERLPSENDRRRQILRLSERGQQCLDQLTAARTAYLESLTELWPTSEIGSLAVLLQRLNDASYELGAD